MAKYCILLLGLFALHVHAAENPIQDPEVRKALLNCYLELSTVDSTLNEGSAVYEFDFKNISYEHGTTVTYSIEQNGEKEEGTFRVDTSRVLILTTTPGEHKFQFYYNDSHYEIYAGPFQIADRTRARYGVRFEASGVYIMTEKPVIYLYPTETTDVSVKLDINGENPFMYPAYNDGWKVTASPNGDLKIGDDTYNYLFWEANQEKEMKAPKTGFVVKGKEIVSFLEKQLSTAGLTSKEQADFITYWAPRMMKHEHVLLHFEFNNTCDKYATIDIRPKPDNIYRIYMIWEPIHAGYTIEEQTIVPMTREGFTVVEWGGQQTNFIAPPTKTNTLKAVK